MGLVQRLFGITVEPAADPVDTYHSGTLAELRVADQLLGLMGAGDRGIANISAAYRGWQLLTDLTAQLPWFGERGGKYSDVSAPGQLPERIPTPPLLADPSPYMDRDEALRMIVSSLIWRGYSPLLLQNLDAMGRPRFASPLHPDEVTVTWDAQQLNPVYHWRGRPMVDGVDIRVIHMPKLPGHPAGLGPFDAARAMLRGLLNANDYAARLFDESATPSGYLKHPGKLNATEAGELKELWETTHQGGRGTGVLSGGITYETISMTPEQAQFLLARSFGIQEVARFLGLPAHVLNAGTPPQSANSLTYTNIPAVRSEVVTMCLHPTYLFRIERAYSQLLPRGQSAAFDLSDFLKGDDKTRFDAAEVAIRSGVWTVDEARQRENLPDHQPRPRP
jgi:HK97 family phage portal protein